MNTANSSFGFAQSGQTGKPAAGADGNQTSTEQAEQNQQEPQYVTKADLDAAMTEMRRLAQSMTGKAEDRVMKRMEELKAAGIQATPEQVQTLLDATEQDAQAQSPSTKAAKAAPAQAQTQPAGGDNTHPVVQQANKIMQKYGVSVDEGDPEYAQINQQTDDPDLFLATITMAAKAKAERVAQQNGTPARLPTLNGSTRGSANIQTLTQQLEKALENPQKNRALIRELKEKMNNLPR